MSDVTFKSATSLTRAIADKTLSAEELMAASLERIAEVNGTVNAVVSLRDPEALLAEARAADQSEVKGPLHELPVAIKDLANAQGLLV